MGNNSYIDPNTLEIQSEALALIPESIARKYDAIPLALTDNLLRVCISEVNNIVAIQEMAAIAKMRIEPVPGIAGDIRQAINNNYRAYHNIEKRFNDISVFPSDIKEKVHHNDVSDTPLVHALNIVIEEAVKAHASDIHIEPQEDRLRIRYRIDGVLHDIMSLPLSVHPRLISRIKVLSNMDIADHRPQDGQFSFKVKDQGIDIRVATIETKYGEMGSLRLLDKSFATLNLTQLGFLPESLQLYQQMLKSPLGMILISGPTGSGKTTTLYASINSLDKIARKIITVEDPVEYRFNNINQIQVNPKAGLTFASGLRSIMRHDPNVILVGEIRDADTAEIASQAALTGHLVLSSVHANDTIGAILRLMDLGTSPFIISATLIGIVSQRMVRKICPNCNYLKSASPEEQLDYLKETGQERQEFVQGRGCSQCSNTGYRGRVAVFEIMAMNQEMRNAMLANVSADRLRLIARNSGMTTMWRDGMLKVQANITTLAEVKRNIFHSD